MPRVAAPRGLRYHQTMQALPYSSESDAGWLDAVPDARAVYRLSTGPDGEPHLGKTAHLRARLQRLLLDAEPGSKALNLRAVVQEIHYQRVGSDFEADWQLYQQARQLFPGHYRRWLRLRVPAMVRLNLANPYPRAHVSRGIGRPPALFFGPFPSRARAELFASHFLDLFKLRRCVDDLAPDAAFPGCIYSEMKMCLAPCFRGCSDAEYAAETSRVERFLRTRGESHKLELEEEREHASQDLEFERAGAAHARLDKLHGVLRELPPLVREISGTRGVLIQPAPASGEACVHLFLFERGGLHGPVKLGLTIPKLGDSLEAFVGGQVQVAFDALQILDRRSCNDHLALLARWFYRTRRQGELLLWNRGDAIPRRLITRACGRVLHGDQEPQAQEGSGGRAGLSRESGGEKEASQD